jgi:Mg2+ and Co2+ transporter CorA
MGWIGNGRLRAEAETLPHFDTQPHHEAVARDQEERLRREDLLHLSQPESQDDARLKEIIASITQEPRAAINQIEQEIGSLRDMITVREQMLVEAIDEHRNLSKEAVRGLGAVRKALGQIRDAFNAAMRPTPILDQQVELASLRRDGREV